MTAPVMTDQLASPKKTKAAEAKENLTSKWATAAAIIIAALWTIPTIGLFMTSLVPGDLYRTESWWNVALDGKLTFENFGYVLFSSFGDSSSAPPLLGNLINAIVVTVPTTVFPLVIGLMAAYAFAWIPFRGSNFLFVFIFALQVVPLQLALIPLLKILGPQGIGIAGQFPGVWVAHTIFAMPLAVFLLHNFIAQIPSDIIEASRVDGASHTQIFFRIIIPLSLPALASLAIFQFLWVWNDLLVSAVFGSIKTYTLTYPISNLAGNYGATAYLVPAAAFVSMVIPLIVFFSLQRYFVRGLLAGSTKG
ncbi:carbohydrate ABC transporter permease [Demequina capsici]|uniref:Carbohydrate ABC transporter permease n=1 Tax=Demequina capsici TaxID=3075620 RepID=A0AA96J7W1_9MICO|nr:MULTISPECIES: carbohydrate ABC transporter permease [unclassified Demequina]WNM24765.1 carbohydrate ABC transporter permease [Demequina sp. OYTSA14]WNM27672.1 carbohydrate ABC transporter permease [Demequina sp. PMTSA13]